MITSFTGHAWQPSRPSAELARPPRSFGSRAWRAYFRAQRYTDDEIGDLLAGRSTVPGDRGLEAFVAEQLEGRGPDASAPVNAAGIVVAYLELRPPLAIHELNPSPPRYLDPAELGARLELLGERHELGGQVYTDVLTGNPWWVSRGARLQLGSMIAAGALYRALGLAAPAWRLVDLEPGRAAACPPLREWIRLEGPPEDNEAIARSRAADLWLLFEGRGRYRRRRWPVPGFPAVIRYDLSAVMGYNARSGTRDGRWGSRVEGVDDLRAPDVPMLRRIAALTDDDLRRAVGFGDIGREPAADLLGTLFARREILRSRLERLTGA